METAEPSTYQDVAERANSSTQEAREAYPSPGQPYPTNVAANTGNYEAAIYQENRTQYAPRQMQASGASAPAAFSHDNNFSSGHEPPSFQHRN